MRALEVGSLLLSTAEGHAEEKDDDDLTLIWVAGAILMMMGAVYVGQLLHSATRRCLKDCGSLRVAMVLDHIGGMTLSLEVMKRYWWCLMMIGLRELQFESKLEPKEHHLGN